MAKIMINFFYFQVMLSSVCVTGAHDKGNREEVEGAEGADMSAETWLERFYSKKIKPKSRKPSEYLKIQDKTEFPNKFKRVDVTVSKQNSLNDQEDRKTSIMSVDGGKKVTFDQLMLKSLGFEDWAANDTNQLETFDNIMKTSTSKHKHPKRTNVDKLEERRRDIRQIQKVKLRATENKEKSFQHDKEGMPSQTLNIDLEIKEQLLNSLLELRETFAELQGANQQPTLPPKLSTFSSSFSLPTTDSFSPSKQEEDVRKIELDYDNWVPFYKEQEQKDLVPSLQPSTSEGLFQLPPPHLTTPPMKLLKLPKPLKQLLMLPTNQLLTLPLIQENRRRQLKTKPKMKLRLLSKKGLFKRARTFLNKARGFII